MGLVILYIRRQIARWDAKVKRTAVLTLLALAVACGEGGEETVPLAVRFLIDTQFTSNGSGPLGLHGPGDPCQPETYARGPRIVVRDGSGETIRTATLELASGDGTVVGSIDAETGLDCDVGEFPIPNVPAADFYAISVEGIAGEVTVSRSELAAQDGVVTIVADGAE
jgi:hypothetical protein